MHVSAVFTPPKKQVEHSRTRICDVRVLSGTIAALKTMLMSKVKVSFRVHLPAHEEILITIKEEATTHNNITTWGSFLWIWIVSPFVRSLQWFLFSNRYK